MAIDRYLRIKQVSEITGLSRATIYNMEKAGDFPQKTVLSTRAVAWRESAVVEWMDSRKNVTKSGREAAPGDTKKSVEKKREIKKEKEKKGVPVGQNKSSLDAARADNPTEMVAPQTQLVQSPEPQDFESDNDWPTKIGDVVSREKGKAIQKRDPITQDEMRSAVTKNIPIRKRF
jgi:prophage regulatory protein